MKVLLGPTVHPAKEKEHENSLCIIYSFPTDEEAIPGAPISKQNGCAAVIGANEIFLIYQITVGIIIDL